MRRCTKCGVDKPLADFGVKRQARDGVNPWCRECSVISAQRRYWRPGGAEEKAAYDRRYNTVNRDHISARGAEKHALNPEPKRQAARRWAKENRAARRAISRSYKARRRAQCEGGVGGRELRAWLNLQRLTCVWCATDCPNDYHIDHVEPLARGGVHELTNLAIACPPCNFRKSAMPPIRFADTIAITYHEDHGEVARSTVTPGMLS